MRTSRWRLGLIVPAGLVLLVGTLAALQYRWLGQVSDAERDAMRAALQHRATEFADDFDREITLAFTTFSAAAGQATAADAAPVAAALAKWRETARFPDIVRAVYFASTQQGPAVLSRLEGDRFEPVDWPDNLIPARTALSPELELPPAVASARAQVFTLGMNQLVIDPPALLLNVINRQAIEASHLPADAQATTGAMIGDKRNVARGEVVVSLRVGHEFLIVELDRNVLVNNVLTALADRHFGLDRYRVSVIDNKERPLLAYPAGDVIAAPSADVALPFFSIRAPITRIATDGRLMTWSNGGGGRGATPTSGSIAVPRDVTASRFSVMVENSRGAAPSPGLGGSAGASGIAASGSGFTATQLRLTRSWTVLLQHSAGSLDKAVAQIRQRNLWLSFGILSVLVAGIGLVVINARRSERLAAQQMDFVATVSHELRTPLAVIRSAAQNLSAGVVHDASQAQRYGDLIEAEGRRLTDMVEQVLEYAGLSGNRQNLRARPIDLGAVVQDVMSASAALIDADEFTVAVEIDTDVPLVLADEGAVRRAFTNLVTNAIKYGGDGRWIGVALRHVKVRGRSEVQLSVRDRGRGIDPEDLPHVFEAFYRGRYAVDRQIHGNGLGLSLVKRIAEAHGGRVTVQSAPGEGATFTLHLPAAIPDPAPQPLPDAAPSAGGHTA